MLDHDDADRAMTYIRTNYAQYYPSMLDVHDAKDVYVFCTESEFATVFKITYEATFKAANGFTEQSHEVVDYVNGFVASDYYNFKRKIYIKKKEEIKWGTLVHEYIHFLQHRNFYPVYYSMGGSAPDVVEGVTEFLTRNACDELQRTRTNYDSQFLKCASWLGSKTLAGADQTRFKMMIEFCFKGVPTTFWGL
jgi:hypothetical protein